MFFNEFYRKKQPLIYFHVKKQTLVPTRSKISVKAVDGVMPDIKQNNLSENTKPAISSTESIHMNLNTSKQTNEESELSVPDPLNFHKSEVDSGQNVAPNMPWHVVNDAMRKDSPLQQNSIETQIRHNFELEQVAF